MKKKFVLALALLLLLPMFGVHTVFNMEAIRGSSTTIYVDPPTLTAPSSENFTVDINIEDVTDLFGWQAWLKWDPQLLDVVNATEGSFLKTSGTTSWIDGMNQSEGWIPIMCTFSDPSLPGVSGNGTLANVKFHGAGPGECVLDLYETKLFNSAPVSVSAPPYLGDVDGDLLVKMRDLAEVYKAFGASEEYPSYNPNADFNNDGFVDLFDLLCVVFNFGRVYPVEGGNALEPVEITHGVHDGYITLYARTAYSVTWKWLDFPTKTQYG